MLPRWLSLPLLALVLLVLGGQVAYLYWEEHERPRESVFDPLIASIAQYNSVDPFLVRALIWRESRFDPLTHGGADEHGLMQVRPDVGQMWAKANKIQDYKDDDLYDPETNIRVGTWYLDRSIKRWSKTDDPVTFALAEYNAGRSNALKWVDPVAPLSHTAFLDRITFPSTRKYVEVILAKRDQYRALFAHDRWYREPTAADPAVTQAR